MKKKKNQDGDPLIGSMKLNCCMQIIDTLCLDKYIRFHGYVIHIYFIICKKINYLQMKERGGDLHANGLTGDLQTPNLYLLEI